MVNISVADFYISEPREIELALEGYKMKQKQDFELNQMAVANAIGLNFTKGYKPINPFKENIQEEKVKQSTAEKKQETLDFLDVKFNKKEGEKKR